MKQLIKKVFGYAFIYHLKNIKKFFYLSPKEKNDLRIEKEEIRASSAFYSSFISPGDFCYDVGANMGNRIKPFIKIGARVLAVEPQESCYQYLNLRFKDQIILVPKGLGSKEEVKDFYVSNLSAISSFSQEWIKAVKDTRFKEFSWNKVTKVEITTLDNLIKIHGRPDFIKIDVEGFETEVLKGLHQPIKLISFEYTVPEQLDKALECINLIENIDGNIECNYSIEESMEFALSEWMPVTDMKEFVKTKQFTDTIFGDIYVRNKNL